MCYWKPHGLPCYVFTFKKHYQREDCIDISKMPQISLRERHEAVGMLRSMTAPAVARHFSVSRSASSRLQDKLVTTGSAEDRRMRTTHLRYRFMSASSTAREWDDDDDVGRHNVGCHLRQDCIKCRRPCKKKKEVYF